jgi:hypothetical protein
MMAWIQGQTPPIEGRRRALSPAADKKTRHSEGGIDGDKTDQCNF